MIYKGIFDKNNFINRSIGFVILLLCILPSYIFSQGVKQIEVCLGDCILIGSSKDSFNYHWKIDNNYAGFKSSESKLSSIEVCTDVDVFYKRTKLDSRGNEVSSQIYFLKVVSKDLSIDFEKQVVCSNHNNLLCATEGFDSYDWSTGDTSRNISIAVPGTYSVAAGYNGCTFRKSLYVDRKVNHDGFYKIPIKIDSIGYEIKSKGKKINSAKIISIDYPDEIINLYKCFDWFSNWINPEGNNEAINIYITDNSTICSDDQSAIRDEFYNAKASIWIHLEDNPGDNDYLLFKGRSLNFDKGVLTPISQEHIDFINLYTKLALKTEHPIELTKSEFSIIVIMDSLLMEYSE